VVKLSKVHIGLTSHLHSVWRQWLQYSSLGALAIIGLVWSKNLLLAVN